ncbi:hypothetical protein HHI36_016208 [Cryptolaemus montrouzieri]|uniref:Uncharacterized protein n=1 Tax=Cryptolaemus montrouzieri TaxID=559131 RepID=A0ABD2NJQ7_9CUCU
MPLTKEKRKLHKLIQQSDSDESEHELSHYMNDRVKLMKEVLKTIKPKKIRAMAPTCLKDMDMEEINSMLLEELLGISNKRLKYIFNGQNLDEDSSSSTNEDEPVDVISLDDVSDDEFVINVDDDTTKLKKVKKEHKHCKVKKEKSVVKKEKACSRYKEKHSREEPNTEQAGGESIDSNKNLMSVLELLELQARARAIKSQLLLENAKTQESISSAKPSIIDEKVGSDDDVIIEATKAEEIVITSSESEDEIKDKEKKENIGNPNESSNKTVIQESNCVEKNESTKEMENDCKSQNQDSSVHSDMKNADGSKSNEILDIEVEKSNETNKIKVLANKEILSDEQNSSENNKTSEDSAIKNKENAIAKDERQVPRKHEKVKKKKAEKPIDNDEIIVLNLSDDEID